MNIRFMGNIHSSPEKRKKNIGGQCALQSFFCGKMFLDSWMTNSEKRNSWISTTPVVYPLIFTPFFVHQKLIFALMTVIKLVKCKFEETMVLWVTLCFHCTTLYFLSSVFSK